MAISQINRALIRPVTIAAAVTGAIQALAWTSLTLVSILYYYSVILIDDTLPTNNLARVIHDLFLDSDNSNENVIVTPRVFDIFMIISVVSNFIWLVVSLYILWAMTRNRWKAGFTAVGGWSALTLYIAILDIVLMSLIAADFNTALHSGSSNEIIPTTETPIPSVPSTPTVPSTTTTVLPTIEEITEESTTEWDSTSDPTDFPEGFVGETYTTNADVKFFDMDPNQMEFDVIEYIFPEEYNAHEQTKYTAYGIIMTLAARGYVLLILNIVFAIVLMKFAFVIKNDEAPSLLPIVGAYATGNRPWNNLYDQTDISNGYSNGAFRDENDQSVFPRSDSFIANDTQIRNQNPLSNGANPYQNIERNNDPSPSNPNIFEGRLARIGKKSGNRTPPLNVPPPVIPSGPYIPDPDYSPPGSPRSKPKSVLRPKSNYVI